LQSPSRIITGGFAAVILIGALLLKLPVSHNSGVQVSFLDALFTSASAVCVTGLVTLETAETFSLFGRSVILILIQIGGLGVAGVGTAVFLLAKGSLGLREMSMIKESFNILSYKKLTNVFKRVLAITFITESIGALLSFFVLIQDFPPLSALGISIFHSVSSFNNAGFDIFGAGQSLYAYRTDVFFNIVTALLIIIGGIGYLVIIDIIDTRSFKKLRLHTKAVLTTTAFLIVFGTVAIKLTNNIPWLGAFFSSVSTRTAGFASYPFSEFSNAGLFICVMLMIIGASPGSTGGGIKTTTVFTVFCTLRSVALNRRAAAFRRTLAQELIIKAFVVMFLAMGVIAFTTVFLCISEPNNSFMQNLFEASSAYGTVGLSTGITASLSTAGKIIIILTMFTGRIGAFALAALWAFKTTQTAVYTEENIAIG
jgi:trk system potassium uptake protein TrkH